MIVKDKITKVQIVRNIFKPFNYSGTQQDKSDTVP